jgi:diguanylate cyclase (GGDEF)-like protein
VPTLRDVPVRTTVPVHAYVSFPLQRADGALFGTLCGWDPLVASPGLRDQQPMLEVLARQLSTILQFELDREDAWRLALQREAGAMADAATGLGDRHAFALCCEREDARCRDLGDRLTVLRFGLDDGHDGEDDARRQRAAQVLRDGLREDAHAARLDGDEFAVLLPGCGVAEAQQLGERLREALASAGLRAWFGCAERKPHRGIDEAVKSAEAALAADKEARKGAGA